MGQSGQEWDPLRLGLAIVAFSLGVEIGHQVVVLPLFAALRLRPRGHFRLSPAASAEAKSGR